MFFFLFKRITENKALQNNFFPLVLLGSERLVGILLGVNRVCTKKMVNNVILINEQGEI